jgi:hypothetical protein
MLLVEDQRRSGILRRLTFPLGVFSSMFSNNRLLETVLNVAPIFTAGERLGEARISSDRRTSRLPE